MRHMGYPNAMVQPGYPPNGMMQVQVGYVPGAVPIQAPNGGVYYAAPQSFPSQPYPQPPPGAYYGSPVQPPNPQVYSSQGAPADQMGAQPKPPPYA